MFPWWHTFILNFLYTNYPITNHFQFGTSYFVIILHCGQVESALKENDFIFVG